jgi:hypothetical protein
VDGDDVLVESWSIVSATEVEGDDVAGDEVDGEDVDGEDVDGEELDGDEVEGEDVEGEDVEGDTVEGDTVEGDTVELAGAVVEAAPVVGVDVPATVELELLVESSSSTGVTTEVDELELVAARSSLPPSAAAKPAAPSANPTAAAAATAPRLRSRRRQALIEVIPTAVPPDRLRRMSAGEL